MIGLSIAGLIILLGVLIFVHEFGHFWAAKKAGVGVLKFSLGFGPKLIGKKIGETEYLISLIPLGGYVKLLGDAEGDDLSSDEKRSFLKQSVYKRFAIVAAGPFFNFLLAIIIFVVVNVMGVPVLTSKLGEITVNSPAYASGLMSGDIINSIDGKMVSRWDRMAERINRSGGRELVLTVTRGDEVKEIRVTPGRMPGKNLFGEEIETHKIGVSPSGERVIERMNPFSAFYNAVIQTWNISKLTVLSVVKMIQGVISPKNLGGPILIAQIAGGQVKEGFVPFIFFMAILSINLAILNLLPIPVLDGGHLLFYTIEMVIRKEISVKWRERAQQVGLALVIMLMIYVIFLDIERLNLSIFQR